MIISAIKSAQYGLKKLGEFMGSHVHVEPYSGDEPCTNCINEDRGK